MSAVETLETKPKKFAIPADTEEKPAWKIEDRLYFFCFRLTDGEGSEVWPGLSYHQIGSFQFEPDKQDHNNDQLLLDTALGTVIFIGPKVGELYAEMRKGRADEILADGKAILRIGIAQKPKKGKEGYKSAATLLLEELHLR
jgi:hypothetical protein